MYQTTLKKEISGEINKKAVYEQQFAVPKSILSFPFQKKITSFSYQQSISKTKLHGLKH